MILKEFLIQNKQHAGQIAVGCKLGSGWITIQDNGHKLYKDIERKEHELITQYGKVIVNLMHENVSSKKRLRELVVEMQDLESHMENCLNHSEFDKLKQELDQKRDRYTYLEKAVQEMPSRFEYWFSKVKSFEPLMEREVLEYYVTDVYPEQIDVVLTGTDNGKYWTFDEVQQNERR